MCAFMRRYGLLLACGFLVAGVLVVSAPGASPVDDLVHFVTPDRDIECEMSFDPLAAGGGFGRVACGTQRKRFGGSGACFFGSREEWSRRWILLGPAASATASAGPREDASRMVLYECSATGGR